ncbi:Trm112 family protein [Candidatus Palibaumannia cicadellinicola]|uniref:UPF0434 protein AB162_209 n=1 Tax=Candidatus Palibaumannia cicadellinicola TaxID=186490 RepID=A0A0K2BK62_9GAMM|nr:Trm112 family protein [Candidatus Baumannia cicadellinicola]AKZ65811.1 KDO2-Lipid A biosynthesis cluster [Candidatus Baumannia cicadellinicola]
MDYRLLDIIACPVCNGKLYLNKKYNELICKFDELAYPIRANIPVLLTNEARVIIK